MKTFQDLEKVGMNEIDKLKFCKTAVQEFMGTADYRLAKDGQSYYDKHNITIERFEKFLYTVSGNKVKDIFSTNYKLKTQIFRRLCIQQVQYVLGNGMKLEKDKNKEKLGKDFDFKLQTAAKLAMAQGKAFGFWNIDHLEVFSYADTPKQAGFCPLYDEYTSQLRAGIRFWFNKVNEKTLLKGTLYEEDGFTDFSVFDDKAPVIVNEKRAYKINTVSTIANGVEFEIGENYTSLPIVPLFSNDTKESELLGIREKVDAYDMIESGLANTIDDASGFYWVVENSGGMDDADLAQFVQRLKTMHAASAEDAKAHAETFDIPVNARQYILEQLRKDIYEDFGALDVNTLSAASKTAQEIQAAYQAQDNKCDDFEYYVIDFCQKIMELAGVEDNPTFNRSKVTNQIEQVQMVMSAAQYLSDECIIQHLPFLTPEEAQKVLEQRDAEDLARFTETAENEPTESAEMQEEEEESEE